MGSDNIVCHLSAKNDFDLSNLDLLHVECLLDYFNLRRITLSLIGLRTLSAQIQVFMIGKQV